MAPSGLRAAGTSRFGRGGCFRNPNQRTQGDLQRCGYALHGEECRVPHTTLDAADVGAVEFGLEAQVLLRKRQLFASNADRETEGEENGGRLALSRHARRASGEWTSSPRTISHNVLEQMGESRRLEVTSWLSESLRSSVLVIPTANAGSEVLLIHAPYPGVLRFPGLPTSLLHAVAPLAHALERRGELSRLGLLDPGNSSEQFYEVLRALLASSAVRIVAISTSTAAIEETARIVALVREVMGDAPMVVVGGPHEDACEERVAHRLDGVDISVAGEGGSPLRALVEGFLASQNGSPCEFVSNFPASIHPAAGHRGRFSLASGHFEDDGGVVAFDLGAVGVAELPMRPLVERRIHFDVFNSTETIPVMVSLGCSFGRCTFCSEAAPEWRRSALPSFEHLRELLSTRPGAALYFQDSILPSSPPVRERLLPLLLELEVEWGAQAYLGTLTKPWVEELARHGCRYVYTGLESAAPEVLRAVGKRPLSSAEVLKRLEWLRKEGLQAGISLMFGSMTTDGALLETAETVGETMELAAAIVERGVNVAGFYPNVQTVLPGTALARGLEHARQHLDFYRMPRTAAFGGFEDGGVGYNFLTTGGLVPANVGLPMLRSIVDAVTKLGSLCGRSA